MAGHEGTGVVAHKYNTHVYGLLASKLAPALIHCAIEPSVDIWVVVMRFIDGPERYSACICYRVFIISSVIGADQWVLDVGKISGQVLPPGGVYSMPSAIRRVMTLELKP